jgi:hypothetical protein
VTISGSIELDSGIAGCEEEKADYKKHVQEYLSQESASPWFLVFDNADDIDMWIAKWGSAQGPVD